jgi:hypothetical protein
LNSGAKAKKQDLVLHSPSRWRGGLESARLVNDSAVENELKLADNGLRHFSEFA